MSQRLAKLVHAAVVEEYNVFSAGSCREMCSMPNKTDQGEQASTVSSSKEAFLLENNQKHYCLVLRMF